MTYHGIKIDDDRIRAFCKANGIVRFALFGSILRDDFTPESDVDVIVEFSSDTRIGLFGIARLERELSDMFGRTSEIHTYNGLHPKYRDEVLCSAEVRYEQA